MNSETKAEGYTVILTPSRSPRERFTQDPETGETQIVGAPIGRLVRFAYDIHPGDVVYAVPLDHQTRYDARLKPPDGEETTARALLRERLEEEFEIRALRRPRTVPVFILGRIEGSPPLPPSRATETTLTGGPGRLEARKASMAQIARFVRTLSDRPVVDETGLEGDYDIALLWDSSKGSPALFEALRTQGLQLAPGERNVEKLIIRRKPSESN